MDLDIGARVDVARSILGTLLAEVDLSELATGGGTIQPSSSATSVELLPLKETVRAVVLNGSSNAPGLERRCALFGSGLYWKLWHEKLELFGPDCRASCANQLQTTVEVAVRLPYFAAACQLKKGELLLPSRLSVMRPIGLH